MHVFETLLILLLGATILSSVARRLAIPYPTLLAVGGAMLAFLPDGPRLDLPPELILALFVAPVLLDAAFDSSLRDLKRSWLPVVSLVLVAVALTTIAVAFAARALLPDLPWAAAIALGALVAPPDAVAALAVMRQVSPPHRIRVVLEGESLLNDASSLLIYRLAVVAMAAGGFSVSSAIPAFTLVFFGSVAAGFLLAWPMGAFIKRFGDAPSSVIFQFVGTFGVWLLAERLHLSGVVTIVVFGVTLARRKVSAMPSNLRVPSFAIWETVTVVLNVLAFTLIGLQLRPILEALNSEERMRYLAAALVILAVVIGVRLAWTFTHHGAEAFRYRFLRPRARSPAQEHPTLRDTLVIGWSGMRGIVTLAAAMALPVGFPYRDFIQLTAFVVVLGTLVIQGLTLRPLIALLKIPKDTFLDTELKTARETAFRAANGALDGEESLAARGLREDYADALRLAHDGGDPRDTEKNVLRRKAIIAARAAIDELRNSSEIGDEAYRRVEEELDQMEISARPVTAD